MIVTHDVNTNSEFVFGSFAVPEVDWNAKIVDALVASASAPTYFPAVSYKGHVLVDGGLSANNPSPIAFSNGIITFFLPSLTPS